MAASSGQAGAGCSLIGGEVVAGDHRDIVLCGSNGICDSRAFFCAAGVVVGTVKMTYRGPFNRLWECAGRLLVYLRSPFICEQV